MSSQARCWISFFTAALLAFYVGYTPLHLFFEEHSHIPVATETEAPHHDGHDHGHGHAEHQPHSSDDHTLSFVAKSFLSLDIVMCEVVTYLDSALFVPVSLVEFHKIPDKSPPNRFSPRGPPAV